MRAVMEGSGKQPAGRAMKRRIAEAEGFVKDV
jgi:hypothetical protein